jgi:hypothetical protein
MLLVRSEPRWSCRPSAASDQNGDRRIQQAVFASPDAVRAFQILTSCTRQCWQCSEVIKLWLAQSLGPNCDTRIVPECLVLWSPGIADELSGDALCTVCAFQTLHLAAPRSQLMTELQSGFSCGYVPSAAHRRSSCCAQTMHASCSSFTRTSAGLRKLFAHSEAEPRPS